MAAGGLAIALRQLAGGRNMVRHPQLPDFRRRSGCVPRPGLRLPGGK